MRFGEKGIMDAENRKIVIIFSIIVLICAFIGLAGTINVPYTAYETETVSEPYTTQETYYEDEVKIVQESLSFKVTKDWVYTDEDCSFLFFGCENIYYPSVMVKNTDNMGGTFTVKYVMYKMGGEKVETSKTISLAPYEEKMFRVGGYKFKLGSWTYHIEPTTKDIAKTEKVQKTKDVVKHRNVDRTKEVIRYQSLWASWFS